MASPFRILILEDSDLDKRILTLYLERSEFEYQPLMVDTEEEFVEALKNFKPDIVLADYLLPGFDGMQALAHHKSLCPDTPFIFVTGQMSEETAIECLKLGAWDYIMKNRIKRLPVAIANALKLRDEMQEKRDKENEIKKSELRFRSMAANISDGLMIVEAGEVVYFNEQARHLLRFGHQNPENINLEELIPQSVFGEIESIVNHDNKEFFNINFEKYYPSSDHFNLCLLFKLTVQGNFADGLNCYITMSDITTARMQQREEKLKLIFTRHLFDARSLEELFEITTASLETYLNVKNFAITVLVPENDMIEVVFIRDEMNPPLSFKAGNTFTARVIKNQELVFLQNEQINEQVEKKQAEYVGHKAKVWMGVPFFTSRYKGAVVIQDYENEDLISKNDIKLIQYIAEEVGKQFEKKIAYETLKTSEVKFRELFENMISGVAIVEPVNNGDDFVLRAINKAAQMIFPGCEKGIGLPLKIAFTVVVETGVFEILTQVFLSSESQMIPSREYVLQGGSIWLDFYLYKLPSSEIVIVFNDHSQRIRSELLLRESEKRYRTLSEITFEGILIHEGGIIIDCNLSFARLFGYDRSELLGQNYPELLLVDESQEEIKRIIDDSTVGVFELTGKRQDKALIPLEIEAKIITQNNKPMRVVAFRDITFRKKALEEIRLSEEKLAKITQSAHDAIILMDHEGNISFFNKAAEQLFDYSVDEVMGKNLHRLIAPPKYHESHNTGFQKFLQNGEGAAVGTTLELEALRKGGEIFPIELSLSAIKIDGQWNAVGILRDISGRKKYEAEIIAAKQLAEEMNRLKTNFLATVSHELRTPLNGILGFSEILTDYLADEEQLQMVEIIRKSSQRLLNTFNLIIDLSVIEANELKVKKKVQNLSELILYVQEPYKASADEKQLFLDVEVDDYDAVIETDSTILSQIIVNLLDNAIKYTETGGVTLSLKKVNRNNTSGYTIEVADTGIGIPPERISLIYDAFRQASEGYNRAFEGMGLGLHITKRYIDVLDGSIDVESEPGKGTRFIIFLPAEPVTHDTAAPENGNAKNGAGLPAGKSASVMPCILYVEDDADHREFVSMFLKNNYTVHLAENGPKGIELAKTNHYDCILMDINLGPQMNGLEAVKEIRKIPGYENTPIAAVTANAMVTQQAEYLSGGCSHYISKPFTKKKLLEYLARMVG